jgi:hypothetical protein
LTDGQSKSLSRQHLVVKTSADSLTAEAAIDFAKQGIDGGGMN